MSACGAGVTHLADYRDLLEAISQSGERAAVVGGQAVNFWATYFLPDEPELTRFLPFTSEDLDLLRPGRSAVTLIRASGALEEQQHDAFGKAFTVVSTQFRFRNQHGRAVLVDCLKTVSGVPITLVEKGMLDVAFQGVMFRVLSPFLCLRAKAHNLLHIPQEDRQDEKHFRICVYCCRAFVRKLLRETASANTRPLLNALETVARTALQRDVAKVARDLGLDLVQCLPISDLRASQHQKVVAFMQQRFPQWVRALEQQATRSRRTS